MPGHSGRRRKPIPLTVIVGALGAGKTRLINRMLADPPFAGTAVILNEFGNTKLAGAAAETARDGIIALDSGCICCSVRGELIEALERLLRDLDNDRMAPISRVVIEAEQAADPSAVIGAVLRHPYLSMRFRPDGIVATTSDPGIEGEAEDRRRAMADAIVVSHADSARHRVAAVIRRGFPMAAIHFLDGAEPRHLTDLPFWQMAGSGFAEHVDEAAESERAERPSRPFPFTVIRERAFAPGAAERFVDHLSMEAGDGILKLAGLSRDQEGMTELRGLGGFYLPPRRIDGVSRVADAEPRTVLRMMVRDLPAQMIERAANIYLDEAAPDTPDRAAVVDNPLSIAGFSARPGGKA